MRVVVNAVCIIMPALFCSPSSAKNASRDGTQQLLILRSPLLPFSRGLLLRAATTRAQQPLHHTLGLERMVRDHFPGDPRAALFRVAGEPHDSILDAAWCGARRR